MVPEPSRPQPDQLQRGHHHPEGRPLRRRRLPPGLQRDRSPPRSLADDVRHRRRRARPGPAAAAELRSPGRSISAHLTMEQAERQAVRLAAAVSAVPYDLRRGPLLRPRLVRFPGDHHRLYLAMHHLVFDGVSVYRVVLPELVALYDAFSAGRSVAACPNPRPATPTMPGGNRTWISGPRVAKRLDYWRHHLTPLPTLHLPLDHPRPESQRFRGGMVPLSVPRETVRCLRTIGQDMGATLFQVLATRVVAAAQSLLGPGATSSSPPPPTCASGPSGRRWSATRSPPWSCGST